MSKYRVSLIVLFFISSIIYLSVEVFSPFNKGDAVAFTRMAVESHCEEFFPWLEDKVKRGELSEENTTFPPLSFSSDNSPPYRYCELL